MLERLLNILSDEALIRGALLVIAIGGPLLGLLAGLAAGASGGRLGRSALRGLAVGLVGTVLGLLWLVYNTLTNHYGLDSEKNLLLNAVIFIVAGVLVSWALQKVFAATR